MGKIRIIRESNLRGTSPTENNKVYPVTTSDAVYVPNKGTLTPLLENLNEKIEVKNDGWKNPLNVLNTEVAELKTDMDTLKTDAEKKIGFQYQDLEGAIPPSFLLWGFKNQHDFQIWYDFYHMSLTEWTNTYGSSAPTQEDVDKLVLQCLEVTVDVDTIETKDFLAATDLGVNLGTYTTEAALENTLLENINGFAKAGVFETDVYVDAYGIATRRFKVDEAGYKIWTGFNKVNFAIGTILEDTVTYIINYTPSKLIPGITPPAETVLPGFPNYDVHLTKFKGKEIYLGTVEYDYGEERLTSIAWTPATQQSIINQNILTINNSISTLENELEEIREAGGLTPEEKEALIAEVVQEVVEKFPSDYASLAQLTLAVNNLTTYVNDNLDTVNNHISDLEENKLDKTEAVTIKSNLEGSIAALNTRIDTLNDRLTSYTNTLGGAVASINSLTSRVNFLETDVTTCKEYDSRITLLETTISGDPEDPNDGLEGLVSDLDCKVSNYDNTIGFIDLRSYLKYKKDATYTNSELAEGLVSCIEDIRHNTYQNFYKKFEYYIYLAYRTSWPVHEESYSWKLQIVNLPETVSSQTIELLLTGKAPVILETDDKDLLEPSVYKGSFEDLWVWKNISDANLESELAALQRDFALFLGDANGEVVWQKPAGASVLVSTHVNLTENPTWALTGLDFTPYKYVRFYIAPGTSTGGITPGVVLDVHLDAGLANASTYNHFVGSCVTQFSNNDNRLYGLTVVISSDKTKVLFAKQSSLYGTAETNAANDQRLLYKIVGYRF